MCTTIRVLLVDDHPVVRAGLRALVGTEPGMEVVGEACGGDEAVRLAAKLAPDVVVMDLVLVGKDGIAATAEIRAQLPWVRVLVLTGYADDERVLAAVRAGAHGFLLKDVEPAAVLRAIRDVSRGEAALHPAVARRLIDAVSGEHRAPYPSHGHDGAAELCEERGRVGEALTEREIEVLRLVAHGLSNQEIADRCVISERTVRTHVSSILAKLRLASRTQAALYALRRGIAHLESGAPE